MMTRVMMRCDVNVAKGVPSDAGEAGDKAGMDVPADM